MKSARPTCSRSTGWSAAEKVAELGGAVAGGDHRKIIALVDEFDAGGRDLVRLLADLQALVRTALLRAIAEGGRSPLLGGVPLTTEQLTRLLDALREGEGGVKLGLAEKVNFEVTLLKAAEATRARAIDTLDQGAGRPGGRAGGPPSPKKKALIDRLEERLARGGGPGAAAAPQGEASPQEPGAAPAGPGPDPAPEAAADAARREAPPEPAPEADVPGALPAMDELVRQDPGGGARDADRPFPGPVYLRAPGSGRGAEEAGGAGAQADRPVRLRGRLRAPPGLNASPRSGRPAVLGRYR